MKFLSGCLLLLGAGIYVNAFAGVLEMDPGIALFNWAAIDAFVGTACIFGAYLAYKETRVREYKAAYPHKLSEERRQAIRKQQKSILERHQHPDEDG